ncbi:MAG: heparinase II/III family protein [Aristaeellaceae bacterium]
MFGKTLSAGDLSRVLTVTPIDIFPPMKDRAAWASVAPEDRQDLLAAAARYAAMPYPMLLATQYMAYVRDGSRRVFEQPYFERRRKLIAAMLHCCLTGKTDQLDTVVDGLWCICEESSWVVSAHNINAIPGAPAREERPLPDLETPNIDLFAAQTAMVLSLVCRIMGEQLDSVTPMLRRQVRREIDRRVLEPFMTHDEFWWMGFIRRDLNNWTPWIISNIMATALSWVEDRARLAELLSRALSMVDRWLAVIPADGGCDEGAGYWNMAGGSLLDCLTLLEQATGGRVTYWQEEKLANIMRFPFRVQLHNGWFVNFADCDAKPQISGERLQTAGEKLRIPALVSMGNKLRGRPWEQVTDTPQLTRLLTRLFHLAAENVSLGPVDKDIWLPQLQLRVREAEGFLLCCKGGHNGESHNHNDVGSFMLYVDGEPVIVDAGNMVYNARTFSDARYTLWHTRSGYHNLPIIGDCEQLAGAQYAARDCRTLANGMELDMAGAYDPRAGVKKAKRFISVAMGILTLEDTIELTEARPVTWVFMLREKPELEPEKIHIGKVSMLINQDMIPAVQEIPITDPRMAGSFPGSLWRLTLTAKPDISHHRIFMVERR